MTIDKAQAFRPVTDEERATSAKVAKMPDAEPIVPVPDGTPAPTFKHAKLGEPVTTWRYTDAKGQTAFHTARFQMAGGEKQILPRSWCKMPDKSCRWFWKWPKPPRPLYQLTEIQGRKAAPILAVEGEKTAGAAQRFFHDHVATTPSAGSNRPRQTDWKPVKGRAVTIWPDADEPGAKFAATIAQLCTEAGAASVRLVQVPENWPDGWDLADDPPEGVTPETLRTMLEAAKPWDAEEAPAFVSFGGYKSGPDGITFEQEGEDPIKLSGPLEVLAQTRSADSQNWGLLTRWHDDDGKQHEWAMPRSLLAGDDAQVRAVFLDRGLHVAPARKARTLFSSYLGSVKVKARARAVTHCGWHGGTFILPDNVIGPHGAERILLQTDTPTEHYFKTSGSSTDWRENVAQFAIGNSRLVLAVSTAFAAPLLFHTHSESGGIHLIGDSSVGKTTALLMAGSVWGGEPNNPLGFGRSWRTTANGLESTAALHCDVILCLDEIGQVSGRDAGETAYMLANGHGKSRANRTGGARPVHKWRCLFLSSGEMGLAEKMREDGRRGPAKAGQLVRMLELRADAGAGYGLFENLHDLSSGQAFADALREASKKYYGTAGPEFVAKLINGGVTDVMAAFGDFRREFESEACPPNADGQVRRAAARFGLIALAGEIATRMGLTGWPPGEARRAALQCCRDWLTYRGGAVSASIMSGLEQVRTMLHAHGDSRFPFMDENNTTSSLPTRDRLGYRRRTDSGVEFCIFTTAWKREFTAGHESEAILTALKEQGHLRCEHGRYQHNVHTPNGKIRMYIIKPSFLADGDQL